MKPTLQRGESLRRFLRLSRVMILAVPLWLAVIPAAQAGVASAEISVIKIGEPDPVVAGSGLTYTVVVSNAGPSSASAVLLVDRLPEEVAFDSVTATQGTSEHSDGTVTALLGTLTAGQSATVEIQVTVDALTTDPIVNTASAEAAELDPLPDNNAVEVETEVIFPDIDVDSLVVSFGFHDADDGPTDPMTITITNAGTADLGSVGVTVEGDDADQYAIDADSGETTLAPDESRTVDVVFDPTGAGAKSARIVIDSDDPDEESVVVQLTGTGFDREIVIIPLGVEFSSRAIDAGPSLPSEVTITNAGNRTLAAIVVALGGAEPGEFAVSSDTGETSLEPGEIRRVGIVFDPSTVGEKLAALVITSDDTDNPSINVPLSGIGTQPQLTGDIDVEPGALDFGEAPVNTSFNPRLLFVASNFGVANLTFTSPGVLITGPASSEFTFVGAPDTSPLPGLSSRSFFILFNPDSEGQKEAVVTVTTDDPDEPTVAVPLAGEGGPPVSAAGLQTGEVVGDLIGAVNLDVDVNGDSREDAADAVHNENMIDGAP